MDSGSDIITGILWPDRVFPHDKSMGLVCLINWLYPDKPILQDGKLFHRHSNNKTGYLNVLSGSIDR